MSEEKRPDKPIPKRLVAYVRLSPEEHDRLESDARASGESVAELMKRVYFSRKPLVLLMSREDQRSLMGTLGRIGNNINQVARVLNSGFREGFSDDLASVRRDFSMLLTYLTSRFKLLDSDEKA
ncbi:MAG: MobC family plasmid mobilization relaxosome protein [Bdellovibrionales bacterium]|nr:MobC family plasmid mobilization relaxosome protein [Bdellovibrionales bacterium]